MGKKNRRNRAAKKRRLRSSLAEHHRVGKKLIPPLGRMPGPIRHTRWADERVPEMLWACLVRQVLPRGAALDVFRKVAILSRELIESSLGPDKVTPTHSNLAEHHPQFIDRIVRLIAAHPLGYSAVRPLLFLERLPGKDLWARSIAAELQPGDVDTLADAIASVLWHQSEESTDIRWLICISAMLAHKMMLPAGRGEEMTEEFRLYPNYGDLRKVRPTIRSMEQVLWGFETQDYRWSAQFWGQCQQQTPCMPARLDPPVPSTLHAEELGKSAIQALSSLSQHWIDSAPTTAVDAPHEGAFALVLYTLRCLLEMISNRRRVAGRLLMRTIVECRITLAYLIKKNDPELWSRFRRYGTGQAKLLLLKISEATSRPPHGVPAETLEQLANEDVWEEFVDIDLGNWAGADLRKLAEDSDTKETYDAHYGWASAFTHGQWMALRTTGLTTCLNPLHRLHRVPRMGRHALPDVLPDAVTLVEAMIADLLKLYPGPTVSIVNKPTASATSAVAAAATAGPEQNPEATGGDFSKA